VAGLAETVRAQGPAAASSRIGRTPLRATGGPYALSASQQRLWFLDQLEPGHPAYNIAVAIRLDGTLDVAALAASLGGIVARHETLRARFPAVDGVAVQEIVPALHLALPFVDLAALPEAGRAAEEARVVQLVSQHSFPLATGPLAHTVLLRLEARAHVLVL